SDDDGVEGSTFGKALAAIAYENGDVGVSQSLEDAFGVLGKRSMALDGINLGGQFRQESGLIPGAGADFEHDVIGLHGEGFQHEGDDVGLRDGLSEADGDGVVFVGWGMETLGNKFVAGNTDHGGQDPLVAHAASAQLGLHHVLPGSGKRIGLGMRTHYYGDLLGA